MSVMWRTRYIIEDVFMELEPSKVQLLFGTYTYSTYNCSQFLRIPTLENNSSVDKFRPLAVIS